MELVGASALLLAVSLLCLWKLTACTPVFVEHPQDTEVKESASATFTCTAQGKENDKPLFIEWLIKDTRNGDITTKNKAIMPSTTRAVPDMVQVRSRLILRDLTVADGNMIVACVARDKSNMGNESEYSAVISRKVGLAILHLTNSIAPPTLRESSVPLGSAIEITCVIPHAFPPPSIMWLQDGKIVAVDTRIRYTINLKNGQAYLNIARAVPLDSGMYACQATNTIGTVKSSTVEVNVTTPSGNFRPVVAVTPRNVLVGWLGVFTCRAWSRPAARVNWTRNNGDLIERQQTDNYNVSGDALSIAIPPSRMTRKARCNGENGKGDAKPEKVTLYRPANLSSFTISPLTMSVEEFEWMSLNCSTSAQGVAYMRLKFVWSIKGRTLSYSSRIRFIEGPGWSALQMNYTTREDAGIYVCTVMTGFGADNTTANVSVTASEPKLISALLPAEKEIDKADTARLQCEVISDSKLVAVQWVHRLTRGERTFAHFKTTTGYQVGVDGTLEIAKPSVVDNGEWLCKMPDGRPVPKKGLYTVLKVVGKPVILNRPPSNITVNIGEEVFLECSAEGIPLPTVGWYIVKENIKNGSGTVNVTLDATAEMHGRTYRCVAGNDEGLQTAETRIFIANLPTATIATRTDVTGGSNSSDDNLAVTIGVAVPCAVIYIVIMVLLVLYCQRRRYSLRSSKDSSQEDVGDGGRDMKELETMKEVDEDSPSTNTGPSAPRETVLGVKGEEKAPVALEVKDEPVRCKPPSLHLEEPVSIPQPSLLPVSGLQPQQKMRSPPPLPKAITLYRAPRPIGMDKHRLPATPSFKQEHCKLVRQLGRGYFTDFFEAYYKQSSPSTAQGAVMLTQFSASELDATGYEEDILSMTSVKHKNVCLCIAANMDSHPYTILTEYLSQGDLKTVMVERGASGKAILFHQQLSILLQLCDAMQYLTAQRFIHRDVAAHSCLVGDDLLVKLAFYSRSVEGHPQDYYTEQEGHEPLPVRWMAPESLLTKEFTSQSDLWSFGVLMWEVFSHGQQPYANIRDADIQDHIHGQSSRLQQPPSCPDLAYQAMKGCWQQDPSDRLIFSQISSRLHQLHTEL